MIYKENRSRKVLFLLFTLGLTLILCVSLGYAVSGSVSSFTGQTNPFNATPTSQTVTLQLPNVYVKNITLNIFGYNETGLCSQESANISSQTHSRCDFYYNGSYNFDDTFNDGYIATYLNGGASGTKDYNYTKPVSNSSGAYLNVTTGGSSYNTQFLQVPDSCWNAYNDKVVFETSYTCNDLYHTCFDGASYVELYHLHCAVCTAGQSPCNKLNEESVAWNLTQYPTNSSLKINNIMVFNYSKVDTSRDVSLNITDVNQQLALSSLLNFTFETSSIGKLRINLSIANYSYGLDNCSNSFQVPSNATSIIFRNWDEDTTTRNINFSADIFSINYGLQGNLSNILNYTIPSKVFNFSICIYPNSANLSANFYVRYTSGFTQRWYLYNQTLTNDTRIINMYNYNDTAGKSQLQITTRDITNYAYLPNVFTKLQRYYNDMGWVIVQEDLSTSYGLQLFNIKEENTDYKIFYYNQNNVLLKQTDSLKFKCTNYVCALTELIDKTGASVSTSSNIYSITFVNASKIETLTWSNQGGTSVTIRQYVTIEQGTGATVISDQSTTASSGTLTTNLSGYSGTARVEVYANGELVRTKYIEIPANTLWGLLPKTESSFWSFGIITTFGAIGTFLGPIGVIIGGVLSVIILYFLQLFSPITITFLAVVIIIGMVIAVKMRH